MIERVVNTLRSVPEIDNVVAVIENPDLLLNLDGLSPYFESGFLSAITAKSSPAQSTLHGFEHLGAGKEGPVLVTTADNCLMTPDMLVHFLNNVPGGKDLIAALALTDDVMRAYPDARRTRMRFRDGGRSGCNLFALQTPEALRIIGFWRTIEQNRKSPLTMLRQLGYLTALRYVTNQLSAAQAIRTLEKRTNTRLGTVTMPYPEAAIDVDTPDDYYLAQQILTDRASP